MHHLFLFVNTGGFGVRLRKFCQSQGKTLLFMIARENNHKPQKRSEGNSFGHFSPGDSLS
jgi:hypothetical protein